MMITDLKAAQRAAGKSARRALTDAQHKTADAAICSTLSETMAFRTAETILAYAAFGSEVSVSALCEAAAQSGKQIAYPVCGENYTIIAAVPAPNGWATGAYGILTPILERAVLIQPKNIDLVIVPCTAFDAECYRVGMGKGYYDRYLPLCTNAVKIGVAYETQRVEHAAVDKFDQRLDAFISEKGIYLWK